MLKFKLIVFLNFIFISQIVFAADSSPDDLMDSLIDQKIEYTNAYSEWSKLSRIYEKDCVDSTCYQNAYIRAHTAAGDKEANRELLRICRKLAASYNRKQFKLKKEVKNIISGYCVTEDLDEFRHKVSLL